MPITIEMNHETGYFVSHYKLNFGLARMYSAFAFESSQKIEVFSEREKAIQWLRDDKDGR